MLDKKHDFPQPTGGEGTDSRSGLNDHRRISDTGHVYLLIGKDWYPSFIRRHILYLLATSISLRNSWALGVIRRYLEALGLPQARALLRLDGLYGTGAVMADLDGLCFVMRGKDYTVLDHPTVQARLHLPPDAQFSRPESILVRTLYDCPDVPVGPEGCRCRVVVATHPATEKKSRIRRTRKGVVYELFFTHLPQHRLTASD